MNAPAYRILDGHVHAFGPDVESLRRLLALEQEFGYEACCFLSCECMNDASQNALALCLKALAPENYAFGGLSYRTPLDFVQELDALMEAGLDGMKMVEDKPTLRREIGVPFNDARYNGFYAALEARGIPLLAHVGDPEEFWDPAAIPAWAKAAGYDYSAGGYPPKETLYAEVEDVLCRFPRLHIILAHLFFLSGDLERLDALMTRHPQVCLDIVAGTELYFNFATRPADWRTFFLKYQDRILFGTDNSNITDPTELANARITNRLEVGFLTTSGEVPAWDRPGIGVDLPREVCEKIFRSNFLRLVGAAPRPLNHDAAARYLENRLARFPLTPAERTFLQHVLSLLR